jgi:hypothetical protein
VISTIWPWQYGKRAVDPGAIRGVVRLEVVWLLEDGESSHAVTTPPSNRNTARPTSRECGANLPDLWALKG